MGWIMKTQIVGRLRLFLLFGIVGLLAQPAPASITFVAEGASSQGVDVRFEAELSIAGDLLTITLTNNSPGDSLYPSDVIGSFYFDIVDGGGDRPVLVYESATGDTYKGVKNGPDDLLETDADLQAFAAGDDSWQFKEMDADYVPNLGFGIGTVGNSNLSPNGFDGNIVGGVNYAIYKGDVTTQSLSNPDVLVKDSAVFTFSGLTGFTEADIVNEYAFGLGTAPDSLITPEPATLAIMGLGWMLVGRRRK